MQNMPCRPAQRNTKLTKDADGEQEVDAIPTGRVDGRLRRQRHGLGQYRKNELVQTCGYGSQKTDGSVRRHGPTARLSCQRAHRLEHRFNVTRSVSPNSASTAGIHRPRALDCMNTDCPHYSLPQPTTTNRHLSPHVLPPHLHCGVKSVAFDVHRASWHVQRDHLVRGSSPGDHDRHLTGLHQGAQLTPIQARQERITGDFGPTGISHIRSRWYRTSCICSKRWIR